MNIHARVGKIVNELLDDCYACIMVVYPTDAERSAARKQLWDSLGASPVWFRTASCEAGLRCLPIDAAVLVDAFTFDAPAFNTIHNKLKVRNGTVIYLTS